ncbi:MBL fold metallo-hydrolase [bacterium]|nr:MBL fold metallo-hydrolase [bacterium]
MDTVLAVAEALWKGEKTVFEQHPFGPPWGPAKISEKTWFIKGFANTVVRETDAGLIIIDPAGSAEGNKKHKAVRSVTGQPLHTAIYTHGHVDHVFGVDLFRKEGNETGGIPPRIIAHEAILDRFVRYRTTNEWNRRINGRQFLGTGKADFPSEFHLPDITYRDQLDLTIGGVRTMLRHARGETDDHTWVFFPDNGVLATGDLMIWAVPNAGNPQKVQRYVGEWAMALRTMAALKPEVLLPGHGFPIIGPERVQQTLDETASYLESIFEQTLHWMNQGVSLDTIIHSVRPPGNLSLRPYLQPIYDEYEYLVRNIWRQYGGWYDGTPSHLKPAPEKTQAREIADLAGGPERLIARADELATRGDYRMACHLAEWAVHAAPENQTIRQRAAGIFTRRSEIETSTMTVGIYLDMARQLGGSVTPEAAAKPVIKAQMARNRESENG